MAERKDPFRNFRFRVEIDGLHVAAFSEATIADSSTDVVDYREGTDPPYQRQLSGLVKYGTISLKRGLTDSRELYEWRKLVEDKGAGAARKSMSVILMDEAGGDQVRWNFVEAWPSKYSGSEFNAKGNDVVIENIEIVHEGMIRV